MKTTSAALSLRFRFFPGLAMAAALTGTAGATLLPFETNPVINGTPTMPQDYGDAAATDTQTSPSGAWQNIYQQGTAWTPSVDVAYGTSRPGEFPSLSSSEVADWAGVCMLWSPSFRTGKAIGDLFSDPGKAMPAGFEYTFTFTPKTGNRSVVVNSFVLDDRAGYFDSIGHSVEWRIAKGSASGTVLASGTQNLTAGGNFLVSTGLDANSATPGPMVLVIKRLSGIEDDLAVDDIDFNEFGFETKSYNTGSLGTAADGLNTADVVLDQPGAVKAAGDFSSTYSAGARTTLPWQDGLNPASNQPFTIEFWARPTATDNDDAPVFNRVSDGNRSGWVFFQRDAATGWNLRMYDGTGSNVGWDLTGGTATLNAWSHVVAVWTGSAARLYVNGALASATNGAGRSGLYNASTSATFSIGSYDNGGSAITGSVDEIAFYPAALTAARISAHYTAASSSTAGTYQSSVMADSPRLYFQQNPPSIQNTATGPIPTLKFTGILSQSENLTDWTDLDVPSPYTPPAPRPVKLFFRSHR